MDRGTLKIKRLGSDKKVNLEVERIEFEFDGERYTITPDINEVRFHKNGIGKDYKLYIRPAYSNEILLK